MAYLDNIIIYLNSVEEYKKYIKQVLRKLYKENMLVTVKKYKFYTKKTDFIKFIIKLRQISIDLKKIKAIVNQQNLKSVIGLKLFLRFCNYYHRFIAKWLKETELFTKIIKKNKTQNWNKEYRKLFKKIKKKFIKESILKIYQLKLLIKVKIDTLDFILGVYIVQKHNNKV